VEGVFFKFGGLLDESSGVAGCILFESGVLDKSVFFTSGVLLDDSGDRHDMSEEMSVGSGVEGEFELGVLVEFEFKVFEFEVEVEFGVFGESK